MGLSQLTGTPWHIEKNIREEGDPRRHRSWCVHYRKKGEKCVHYDEHCRGASHCPAYVMHYKERKEPKQEDKQAKKRRVETILTNGDKIKHVSYGKGIVKEVLGGRVTIIFEDECERVFGIEYCLDKGIITKE